MIKAEGAIIASSLSVIKNIFDVTRKVWGQWATSWHLWQWCNTWPQISCWKTLTETRLDFCIFPLGHSLTWAVAARPAELSLLSSELWRGRSRNNGQRSVLHPAVMVDCGWGHWGLILKSPTKIVLFVVIKSHVYLMDKLSERSMRTSRIQNHYAITASAKSCINKSH